MVDTSALLDVCDAGAGCPAAGRGPWLVDRLGLTPAGVAAADLTVGACDLLLVELRDHLFGPTLELVSTCPGCGAEIECRIDIDDLWPHRGGPVHNEPAAGVAAAVGSAGAAGAVEIVDVEAAGRRLRCRFPSNRDLAELARLEPARRPAAFVQRCVLGRDGDAGAFTPAENLPAQTVAELASALAEALAERDPGACTVLELRCACGAARVDEIDIRSFLWTELTVWAERTLNEVHQLAWAYGWSESDILSLSPRRRRAYLDRCGW